MVDLVQSLLDVLGDVYFEIATLRPGWIRLVELNQASH